MYTLTYEGGIETAETLDEILDRAADLAIEGTVIDSLVGPEGIFSHDLIDAWMYKKLDIADPNVDPTTSPRDLCAIPPPTDNPSAP